MDIKLPDIRQQQKVVFGESTKQAIKALKQNLRAPDFPPQDEINESDYPNTHLLREHEGWEPPAQDIVGAYFRHFQKHFPDYDTDLKLAQLLGLSSDRRVREFKQGKRNVPYNVWRHFLVLTGRAPQDVIPVLGFMG